jgi:hypothetical protein
MDSILHGSINLQYLKNVKKINLSLVFISFLLLALGCSKKNNSKEFFGFTEFQMVKGDRLPVSDNIEKAYELLVVGELLIVSNPNFQYHFTIIDLNEEKKVGEFGKMGDGPCELSFSAGLQLPGNGTKNIVGVNNRNKFSYQEYDLSDVLSGNNRLDNCICRSLISVDRFDINFHC